MNGNMRKLIDIIKLNEGHIDSDWIKSNLRNKTKNEVQEILDTESPGYYIANPTSPGKKSIIYSDEDRVVGSIMVFKNKAGEPKVAKGRSRKVPKNYRGPVNWGRKSSRHKKNDGK